MVQKHISMLFFFVELCVLWIYVMLDVGSSMNMTLELRDSMVNMLSIYKNSLQSLCLDYENSQTLDHNLFFGTLYSFISTW